MRIAIGNYQNRVRLRQAGLMRALAAALRGREADVSVAVVTRQKIRALNRRHLHRDVETDVLAFDLASESDKGKGRIVGEIVVSADRASTEAKRRGHAPEAELALYVVHGALHLMGMDDHRADNAAAMHRAALEILRRSGHAPAGSAGFSLED